LWRRLRWNRRSPLIGPQRSEDLLIERAGFSGGIITTVGLPYFDGLIDKPSGRFVVKGIALELLEKLGVAKAGAKHIDDCVLISLPVTGARSIFQTLRSSNCNG